MPEVGSIGPRLGGGRKYPAPAASCNGHTGPGKEHAPDHTRLFTRLGLVFRQVRDGQALAEECPFCGKDRFYVAVATGLYDWNRCAEKGNPTTYLTWLHRN